MTKRKPSRAVLVATFAGAMIAASPAIAERSFQLKNCDSSSNAMKWDSYNANDHTQLVPYMTVKFDGTNQTKTGKCVGDNEGYCNLTNTMDPSGNGARFKVYASATIYGGSTTFRHYSGLLDCNSEPAH